MYNFDKKINRLNTNTIKWDGCKDIIPLWIADMDFECADEIKEAIIKRANHNLYGYTKACDEAYNAIINWQKTHNNNELKKNNIVFNTGVMYGVLLAIKLLSDEGDKIIVQTPVYPPFMSTPNSINREVVTNPLINNNGYYKMDLKDLESKLKKDPKIKMMLLCNPHNPVGRVWKKDELEALVALLSKYQVFLVCDEIHGDLMIKSNKLTSIYQVDEKYHNSIIAISSPTKTFNIAGLKVAYMMIKDVTLQERFAHEAKIYGINSINVFGYAAIRAAYENGQIWLNEVLAYIESNFEFLDSYLNEYLPKCHFLIPEGTYLAWVDFSEYGIGDDFFERLTKEGGVFLNPGKIFSLDHATFARINVACSRELLKEALDRIVAFINKNQR